ncbi:MAG TPA: copper-binding protein [Methylomirabilota bacterium]|nr:copper-binding protein [Methylomirabilota bacterium]
MRPAAYEVRATVVARAAPGLLLVRHAAVSAFGMEAMETMALEAGPETLDAAGLAPGDRVRVAVRRDGDRFRVVWIERER